MRDYRDLLNFFLTQRFVGFAVPGEPHFDEVSTPYFLGLIVGCRHYLEYGSGGSTVVAANLGKPFISVDTDRFFLKSVAKKIGARRPDQRLAYADIGLTGPWGAPLRTQAPSIRRLNKWKAYPSVPWRFINENNPPDLILVDGRFRVASALTCLMQSAERPDTKVLVDDYANRPHYFILEQYAKLVTMAGRMAVFQPQERDPHELTDIIDRYSRDWR